MATERMQMELERVVEWLRSDEPKTAAELRRAAASLARRTQAGDLEAAKARLRIAVKLEQLERLERLGR